MNQSSAITDSVFYDVLCAVCQSDEDLERFIFENNVDEYHVSVIRRRNDFILLKRLQQDCNGIKQLDKYVQKKHLNEHCFAVTERRKQLITLTQCQHCKQQFSCVPFKNRHESTCIERRTCRGCKSVFPRVSACFNHEKKCDKVNHQCDKCQHIFNSADALRTHKVKCLKRKHEQEYKCSRCDYKCTGRRILSRHITSQHGGDQPLQDFNARLPDDDDFRQEYNVNQRHILANHRTEHDKTVYNFPTSDLDNPDEISNHLNHIFEHEDHAFRLNVSLGMILRDVSDNSYRYFIPYTNEQVFPVNEVVSNRRDLARVITRLRDLDLRAYVNNLKPKSSLKPFYVTNINYYVYPTDYPLGCHDVVVPNFIKNCRYLVSMDRFRSQPFNDNLCMFRCLYYSRHKNVRAKGVQALFEQWCDFTTCSKSIENFKGVQLSDVPKFEDCFRVCLNIYDRQEESGFVIPRYLSKAEFDNVLYLNMYQTHVSYITNFRMYAKKFQCPKCLRHWKYPSLIKRHLRSCSNNLKLRYPGGYVKRPTNINEEIEFYGIQSDFILYDKFATFDFEAILEPITLSTNRQKMNAMHRAVSVSVNSNVSGFREPRNMISNDLEDLLCQMIDYLSLMQATVAADMRRQFQPVLDKIEELLLKYECKKPATINTRNDNSASVINQERFDVTTGFDGDSDVSDDEINDSDSSFIDDSDVDDQEQRPNPYLEERKQQEPRPNRNGCEYYASNLKRLYVKIETFCDQLPVLGFNSSKYDLNLIKSQLTKCLNVTEDKQSYVIKKCNKYMVISTNKFRFLDVCSYLAPNVSYSQFLKCYDIQEQKQHFPYEFLDSFEKLNYPELPPVDAFFSTLKNKNTLDDGDKSIEENYQDLHELWQNKQMTSLADLLEYYNNYDVIGLTLGIEKLQQKFLNEKVSIFKETISISNYARRKLFRSTDVVFPLFDNKNRDIFNTIQNNIVGGPSIIFTRFMEVGKTVIKNNMAFPVKNIIGLDANALYPFALSQEMPTGPYIDRREENNFKAEISSKHVYQYAWMDKIAYDEHIEIKHKLNNAGKECRIGPYLVDGLNISKVGDDVEITVYEFQGCFHHFHDRCQLLSNNPKTADRQLKSRARTEKKKQFLLQEGFKFIEIWECDFIANHKTRCEDFIYKYVPTYFQNYGGRALSQQGICGAIKQGNVFGLVECDIEVNDPNLEYKFNDFPPIFCTSDVSMNLVGDHMLNFMTENKLSLKPRRQLVSGTKASKILLATPLLRWYLQNGFKITHVYRVVEFQPEKCFKRLIEEGTQERREGDVDKTKSILADTAKITLNSYYGSLIMDKTKHRRVKYVKGLHALRLLVNDPLFVNSTDLGDELFEVELLKRSVSLDMCNYIAHFVLNNAKLHMIKFVYEVLHKYLTSGSWQYLEMDTDSLYSGFSEKSLLECVKPSLRQEFEDKIYNSCHLSHVDPDSGHWFPRECCSKHRKYDKRSPGLMKTEQTGDMMICLSSKTYLLTDKDKYKLSCKGVRKDLVNDPINIFRSVLDTKQPKMIENVGFKAYCNSMVTYTQKKTGFSWVYTKRQVLANGIDTRPLKIVLSPWRGYQCYVIDKKCTLSNDSVTKLSYQGMNFFCAQQLYMYLLAVHVDDENLANRVVSCKNAFVLNKIDLKSTDHDLKQSLMTQALNIKFEQSEVFRELLKDTGTRNILMSGTDMYWEVGMSYRYAIVSKPQEFPGANFLGLLLQHVFRIRL